MKKQDRCTGHCCRSFSLRMSPAEIEAEFKTPKDNPHRPPDIDRLHEMVIYLGQFQTNPILETKDESWPKKALLIATRGDKLAPLEQDMEGVSSLRPKRIDYDARGQHWYACRHVQLNGDCGIYEQRPELCRRYPNGHVCQFVDCTWSEESQKRFFKKTDKKFRFQTVYSEKDTKKGQFLKRGQKKHPKGKAIATVVVEAEDQLIPDKALTRRKRTS